jgi:amidohydrolase
MDARRVLDERIRDVVDAGRAEVVRIRREIHRHPELAFEEHRTADLVAETLKELGVTPVSRVAGTGVVAVLQASQPGPTLLLRADMDALPITEADDGRPSRSSRDGVMHACGHDGHVAVLLGAVTALHRTSDAWRGRVVACFQPAEEPDTGARAVLEAWPAGDVDAVLGLHLDTTLPTGTVAVGEGLQWARCTQFTVDLEGEPGHAGFGTPVDAVAAAAEAVLVVERLSSQWPETSVAAATMVEGAQAPNVVPRTTVVRGTLRTLDPASAAARQDQFAQAVVDAARARGARAWVTWGPDCPELVCDPGIAAVVRDAAVACRSAVVTPGVPTTGCDDFSRFLALAPGCYFRVGAAPASGPVPHHHPEFDLDESALAIAVETLSLAAVRMLEGGPQP